MQNLMVSVDVSRSDLRFFNDDQTDQILEIRQILGDDVVSTLPIFDNITLFLRIKL